MKFTRTREHVVNMGNYESFKFGGSVEVEIDNLLTPEDYDSIDTKLDALLANEVKEARELTNTKDSYILSYRSASA